MEKEPFLKASFHNTFTNRNKMIALCRLSKTNYYKHFFNSHKRNLQMIWEGVRSIISIRNTRSTLPSCMNINNNLISDPLTIATSFNDYFSFIAEDIRKTIPPTSKSYFSYLKHPVSNTIFMSTTDNSEILYCLSSLDFKKSTGPFSIPSQIWPISNKYLAKPLSQLINLSFSTGIRS